MQERKVHEMSQGSSEDAEEGERERKTNEKDKLFRESISDLWQSKLVGVSPVLPGEPALPEH